MSLSISTNLASLPLAHPPDGKAKKAAQDFEGILLSSLLEPLQKSFSGDGESGSGDYGFMGTQALASAIAARGGIGIARLILNSWAAQDSHLLAGKDGNRQARREVTGQNAR